jgi:hypothetical protein
MQPGRQVIAISGISNREFLDCYAKAGCIGLCGGSTWVDKAICRAERHLDDNEQWGTWSHAFIFQGRRCDGHHWVIESDLQIHHKHIQLGVQENRASKYDDEQLYRNLAVYDFGLNDQQVACLLTAALDLAAGHTRYSVRELFGTLLSLRYSRLRSQPNLLARQSSVFCSAFVRRLFSGVGIDLAPEVDIKNTTPEHIALSSLPHKAWVLQRWTPGSRLRVLGNRIQCRMGAQIRVVKRRLRPGA